VTRYAKLSDKTSVYHGGATNYRQLSGPGQIRPPKVRPSVRLVWDHRWRMI